MCSGLTYLRFCWLLALVKQYILSFASESPSARQCSSSVIISVRLASKFSRSKFCLGSWLWVILLFLASESLCSNSSPLAGLSNDLSLCTFRSSFSAELSVKWKYQRFSYLCCYSLGWKHILIHFLSWLSPTVL